jgi:5'-deoxynucleotidase YfbR-like HD superfamily hydrolase
MSWILTSTGKHFDFADPQPDQVDIIDIANGLAKQCRFSGQCREFYSVAQHSVLVSQYVVGPRELALEGLLHDAAEAYCQDIPSPLKTLLPDYHCIEQRVQNIIYAKFGIEHHPQRSYPVFQADLALLATERRDLMPEESTPWPILHGIIPLAARIEAIGPKEAFWEFIHRFNLLTGWRGVLA